MKKVLITGVNGLIGSAIAEFLLPYYEVIGTSIEESNNTGLNFKYIQFDITDKSSFDKLPQKVDVIIHCAAVLTSDDASNLLVKTNCIGIHNMGIYSKNVGCQQFIYCSGLPIIGKPFEIPITEKHPINPLTVYHITKFFGELVLKQMLDEKAVVILRITSPVGRKLPSNKITSVFVKNAVEGVDLKLNGQGKRIQNYIDVRDIARAVACAIKKEAHGIFNIASERSYSNRELAELCIKLFKSKSKITFDGIDKEEDYQWIVSTAKAKKELGFETQYSLSDTLQDLSRIFKDENSFYK